MIVGAALIEIHVHDSRSLKAKRGVVKSIAARLRSRFDVAVAEVGGQQTWQRAVIGLSTVGTDAKQVRRRLEKAVAFVEQMHRAEVIGSDVELLDLPHEALGGGEPWAPTPDDDDPDGPAALEGGEE